MTKKCEWNAFQFIQKEDEPETGKEIYLNNIESETRIVNWSVDSDFDVFNSLYRNGFGYPTIVVNDNEKVFLKTLLPATTKSKNFQEQMTIDMIPLLIEGATPREIEKELMFPLFYIKYVLSLMMRFGLCSFKKQKRERTGKFAVILDQNVITALRNQKLLGCLFGQTITESSLLALQSSLVADPTVPTNPIGSTISQCLSHVFGKMAAYEGRFQGIFPTQALSNPLKLAKLALTCDAVVALFGSDPQGFWIPRVVSLAPVSKVIPPHGCLCILCGNRTNT